LDMKINIEVIKQARVDKNWTQQQLAEICGLSLRTIQRIEKTGIASHESIASLSSAFEIDKDNFILSKNDNYNLAYTSDSKQGTIREKLANFLVMFEQTVLYVMSLVAIGLFILGIVGLTNSNLDTRVQLLITVVFSSGVLFTLLVMRLSNKNSW